MLRFTAKGRIQVWDGEVLVSSHVQEREAYERIAGLAPGKYTVTFPVIEVVSSGAFKSVYSTSSESGRVEARGMAVQVVRLLSDTTPPAVPSDFSASAATATSVTLTLTANVESDFSNYVLERSSDNIGWGYLKSFTGTSTTDTVDVNNSVYYYRAFSIDARGNRSAYTAVKSAGPYTAEFGWLTNVFPVSIPKGGSLLLDPYINDPGGQLSTITSIGEPLPTGVSIQSNPWRLAASTSASAGTSTGHQLQLNGSAEADWQARASAAGVIWAHDFRTDAEVDSFRWENGKGDDPGRVSPGAAELIRQTSDGIAGTDGACIEITRGLGLGNQQLWWRPFSPSAVGNGSAAVPGGLNVFAGPNQYPGASAISNWNHGNVVNTNEAGGSERISGDIYFSFRMKLDPRIIQSGYIGTDFGGKILYVSRTEASLVAQEVIMQTGEQTPPTAADVHLVQFNRYLDYRAMLSNTAQPGSIAANQKQPGSSLLPTLVRYPYGEWRSYMFHFVAGRENDNLSGQFWDSQIQLYQCADGDTAWTKIWDVQTYGFDFQNSYTKGWNAIILSNFHNAGYDGNPFWMRWTQCILSTQWINPPST